MNNKDETLFIGFVLIGLTLFFYLMTITNVIQPKKIVNANPTQIMMITAYSPDTCGKLKHHKGYNITASNQVGHYGIVASNWIKQGSWVKIKHLGKFVVADKGARSLFGSKDYHIPHLDVYFSDTKVAKQFGVKWLEVEILEN